eukprot:CFRG1772T1
MLSRFVALGRLTPRLLSLIKRQAFRPDLTLRSGIYAQKVRHAQSRFMLAAQPVRVGSSNSVPLWSGFLPRGVKPLGQSAVISRAFGPRLKGLKLGVGLGLVAMISSPALAESCDAFSAVEPRGVHEAPRSVSDVLAVYKNQSEVLEQKVNALSSDTARLSFTLLMKQAQEAALLENNRRMQEELESTKRNLRKDKMKLEEAKKQLAKDNQYLAWRCEVESMCVICMDTCREMRFDCGHLVACKRCTDKLLDMGDPCPICRSAIGIPLPVYVS